MDGQILGQLRPLAEEEEEDGAALAPRPAFPGMGSEELRLASFYDWPLSAVVPPELLAAAGFFHTGESRGALKPFYTCSLPCSLSCASDLGRHQNSMEQLDLCWGDSVGVGGAKRRNGRCGGICWPRGPGRALRELVVWDACSSPRSEVSAPNLLIVGGEAGVTATGVER